MPGKRENWLEAELGPMLERVRIGTERTNELLKRSQEHIRFSCELLSRELPKRPGGAAAGGSASAPPPISPPPGNSQ